MRRRWLILIAAFVTGLGAGAAIWASTRDSDEQARVAGSTPIPVAAEPPPPPEPKPKRKPVVKQKPKPRLKVRIDRNAANPVAVSVRAVGITAPVIPLGLEENGKLESPKKYSEAGWRRGGPEPGERGAAVIAGHVDSRSGPAAFYRLREVAPGTEIEVRRQDGSTVKFVAQRSETVAKNDFPTQRVYGETPLPTLRLVTCGGSFSDSSGHYRDNVIVYATRKPS